MRVVRIHANDESFHTAVMGEPSRIFTPYVMVEFPVRLRRIANGDVASYVEDMDYPLKKACRHLLRMGREHDISKAAKTFLKEAMK